MKPVEVINLSKKIGGKDILQEINLTMEKGKIYGLFGRNASGKTMLFRAICGLIKPTTGIVKIQGKTLQEDISFPPSIGVIIESPGFWSHYTGFENLKVLASIKNHITDKEIKNSLKRVGLDPEDKRMFKKYSLGMKQRLAMAQAIMEQPDILVLDEPTNALDEEGISLVRQVLLEEKARGASIIIASHNKEDIEFLSDSKIRIDQGRLKDFIA